jgi:hypothetical protein
MQLQCAGIIDFGYFAISIGHQDINGLFRGSVDYDYTRIRDPCARISVNHSQFEGSGRRCSIRATATAGSERNEPRQRKANQT